jgi:hypothetical protein
MPFKSQAQRGFMYANHPEIAKEFEAATPKGKKLPEHVKGGKRAKLHARVKAGLKKAFPK